MHPYQTDKAVHRLIFLLTAFCLALATGQAREAGDRPNVVVFFLDDSGYGDFAHHGNPTIRTENISKLAEEGSFWNSQGRQNSGSSRKSSWL